MIDTQDILQEFYSKVHAALAQISENDSLSDRVKFMAMEAPIIAADLSKIGDQFHKHNTDLENISATDVDKYIISHHWIDHAKGLLVLWRDVILETTKALHFENDEKIDFLSAKRLMKDSSAMITSYLESLKEVYPGHLSSMGTDTAQIHKQVKNWKKQIDPWPTYLEQIKVLTDQSRNISNLSNQIGRSNTSYKTIKRIIANYIDKHRSNMEEISAYADSALENINEIGDQVTEQVLTDKINKIEQIRQQLNHLFVDNHHLEQIEKIINELPGDLNIPVSPNKAQLNIKNVSLKRTTLQWLESEIYLALYEVEEVEDHLKNSLKMTLINIKNRLTLLKNENSQGKGELLKHAIEKFKIEYRKTADKHSDLIKKASDKIDLEFNISDLFNENRLYLPQSYQSSLGSIDLSRNKLRHKFSDWMKDRFSAVQNIRNEARKESKLSQAEKLVRFIESRKYSEENSHYINIFLVKGYIGESFVIGREEELEQFADAYQNWKKGYRGSVCITGQRFSGKSLFAEYANIKLLDGKAILLKPGYEYEINSTKLRANYNLKDTLSKISKNAEDSQPVVILDDIEQWYDKENSVSSNIRRLSRVIDRYSAKVFFVVTMSNWIYNKMNKVYGLEDVFQSYINLDRMTLEEIRSVIGIRQGSTHKDLVNQEENKISPEEFNKITKKIHDAVQGNVGEALSKWASSTEYHQSNTVMYRDPIFHTIPDINHMETLLLLEAIIMARKTTKYHLRSIFGDAFNQTHGPLLQRLVNIGIVTRNYDNLIIINPLVVNDVGRLLERKRFLTFNHR